MADAPVQTYATHRRYLVTWHFIAMPIIGAQVAVSLYEFIREPGLAGLWNALVMVALFLALLSARWMALRVQNRLVRLEENLRLERLLPGRSRDLERLTLGQLIGIRFASDAEVPHLVDRMLSGELRTADEVKQAVQHWRPDHLRV
jgi:hypothetical protein